MMRCDLSVRRWLRALQPPSVRRLDLTPQYVWGLPSALTDDVPWGLETFTSVWALGRPDGNHFPSSVLQIHALQL